MSRFWDMGSTPTEDASAFAYSYRYHRCKSVLSLSTLLIPLQHILQRNCPLQRPPHRAIRNRQQRNHPLIMARVDRAVDTAGETPYRIRTAGPEDSSVLRRAAGTTISHPDAKGHRASFTAAAEGIANVTFGRGDPQVYPFPDAHFDVAISRGGIMTARYGCAAPSGDSPPSAGRQTGL